MLKSAVTECNQLSDTLTTWKNGKTLMAGAVPVAVGWFTTWLGADNLLSALPQFGIEISGNLFGGNATLFLRVLIWAVTSMGLLALLLNQAFEGKRSIFLPTLILERVEAPTHNIYASEDALFKLIGNHKTPEFALDAAGFIFFVVIAVAGFFLRAYYYASTIGVVNWIALPISIGLIVWILILHGRRWR